MSKIKRFSVNVTVETIGDLDTVQPFDGLRVFINDTKEFWYWDKNEKQFILEGGGSGPGPSPTPTLSQVLSQGNVILSGQVINVQGGSPNTSTVGSIYGSGPSENTLRIDGQSIRLGSSTSSIKM